jgi:predicted ribosome quality control (RQC) complex YloA/Tae2 family protein
MAQFNFYLREPNSSKPTPIILRATFSGYKIKCKTNESVLPDMWDNSTQRAKISKSTKNLNTQLDNLKVAANDAHKFFTQVIKQIPTQSEYQSKFYEEAGFVVPEQQIEPEKLTFIGFI